MRCVTTHSRKQQGKGIGAVGVINVTGQLVLKYLELCKCLNTLKSERRSFHYVMCRGVDDIFAEWAQRFCIHCVASPGYWDVPTKRFRHELWSAHHFDQSGIVIKFFCKQEKHAKRCITQEEEIWQGKESINQYTSTSSTAEVL